MKIYKCRWRNGAESPVMFMIDDLANVWLDANGNGVCDIGEDWGHMADEPNSMWDFLCKNILDMFPEVKVTFFLVVGERASIIKGKRYTYCGDILADDKFLSFLRKLDKDPRIEIAYHGLTHGLPGAETKDFIQEWQTFNTLDEAIQTIEKGKEIFYRALGHYPRGGKYPGYAYNHFSDKSIAMTEFEWWCRHIDVAIEENKGDVENYSYELEYFDGVVDIPTTIDGAYYSLKVPQYAFTRKYAKSLIYKLLKGKSLEGLIDARISKQQIISIQEHTSPVRTDGRIQYPNIVTDIYNLQYILKYLRKYHVWYATGSEVAQYFKIYEATEIKQINDRKFLISTAQEFVGEEISIRVDSPVGINLKIGDTYYNPVLNHKGLIFNIPLVSSAFEVELC